MSETTQKPEPTPDEARQTAISLTPMDDAIICVVCYGGTSAPATLKLDTQRIVICPACCETLRDKLIAHLATII